MQNMAACRDWLGSTAARVYPPKKSHKKRRKKERRRERRAQQRRLLSSSLPVLLLLCATESTDTSSVGRRRQTTTTTPFYPPHTDPLDRISVAKRCWHCSFFIIDQNRNRKYDNDLPLIRPLLGRMEQFNSSIQRLKGLPRSRTMTHSYNVNIFLAKMNHNRIKSPDKVLWGARSPLSHEAQKESWDVSSSPLIFCFNFIIKMMIRRFDWEIIY